MSGSNLELGPREQQIADLLMQGCSNSDIATQLQMNPRTVKAHFNRLFERFGIRGGVKRVKLATLLYRRSMGLPLEDVAVRPLSRRKFEEITSLPKIDNSPHPSSHIIPRA